MCDDTFWKLTQIIFIFAGETKHSLFGSEECLDLWRD